jgi:alkylation response protein AidB-like acyl-CoA dehydrogenase
MLPVGTPGFRIGKVFNKSGWRFYQNAELIFEDARVPHANVLGEVNGGSRARQRGGVVEFNDFELACNALGVCDDACECALSNARTEKRGGRLLIEHQSMQLRISEMQMLTEALRSFLMRVAQETDRGISRPANSVLLMNFSGDAIQRVTKLNLAIHGAPGGVMNARADKLVRDGIIWTHLASDATQRLKVIRRLAR